MPVWPTLHRAVSNGHVEMTQVLLAAGADVNARNVDGKTPLHFAVNLKDGRVELVQILLAAGADVDSKDRMGITPLAVAKHGDIFAVLLQAADSQSLTKSAAQGGSQGDVRQ
mmetsp:Transcript_39393/g.92606  ORF Transcript_39393/g.92606 Transcript_39393/m.92606 type:complete len:112 (-) Transcript_39393:15-350(-)